MSVVAPKRGFSRPEEKTQEKQEVVKKSHQQAKKTALLRRLGLLGVLFSMTAIFFAYVHFQDRAKIDDQQTEQKELEKQVETLGEKQARLEREIVLLNDEDYVLKLARTQFFFSRDGETIFAIQDEN